LDGNLMSQPFMKWAGGKRQLLPELRSRIPHSFGTYFEPFLGGGALFFSLGSSNAVLNDINVELIECYETVRDRPEQLIESLRQHVNTEEYFYAARARDPGQMTKTEAASRLIYLNRTCFNGLYRVNQQGRFNTPYGRYKSPNLVPEELIREASTALRGATLLSGHFGNALALAEEGDFIYLDPPYFPTSDYSDFRRYSRAPFDNEDQRELAQAFKELSSRGCFVMLSNSSVKEVHDLYADFQIETIKARRNINSQAGGRGDVDELVVRNY
jgi:DNA adenine methylase